MEHIRGLCLKLSFSLVMILTALHSKAQYMSDDGILIDTGYHIQGKIVEQSFLLYSPIKQLYAPGKISSPYAIKFMNTTLLRSITNNLESYIKDEKNGKLQDCSGSNCINKFQDINGLTESQLATELINASYCFGTDPYIIASKVRQESKFDTRSISPTGAIGLTQMTEIGLEEILDQLGHRGAKFAEPEIKTFIEQAANCYLGSTSIDVFKTFPKIETYTTKKSRLDYTPESITNFKKWFSYSKFSSESEKKLMVKKQIILGQILLKVYLTYSYSLSKNKNMTNIYNNALKMFNGDRIKVRYAKEVMRKSIPRNFM